MTADTITAIKKALERQTENMAFIINHVSMPEHWRDKFMRELDEDRSTLSSTGDTHGN